MSRNPAAVLRRRRLIFFIASASRSRSRWIWAYTKKTPPSTARIGASTTIATTSTWWPALWFTNVRGSRMPLLINQFGTERRMCMAFGVEHLGELGQRVNDVLEMQPPEGLVDKVRALQRLKSLADSRPRSVSRGPCQEV